MFTIKQATCKNPDCSIDTFNYASCELPICPACGICARCGKPLDEHIDGCCPTEECPDCGHPMSEHDAGVCPKSINEDAGEER